MRIRTVLAALIGIDCAIAIAIVEGVDQVRRLQGLAADADYLIKVFLTAFVLGFAAIGIAVYQFAFSSRHPVIRRLPFYMASGGFGCGGALSLLGYARFLGVPGFVWQYPVFGGLLGAAFGILFWIILRVIDRPPAISSRKFQRAHSVQRGRHGVKS